MFETLAIEVMKACGSIETATQLLGLQSGAYDSLLNLPVSADKPIAVEFYQERSQPHTRASDVVLPTTSYKKANFRQRTIEGVVHTYANEGMTPGAHQVRLKKLPIAN